MLHYYFDVSKEGGERKGLLGCSCSCTLVLFLPFDASDWGHETLLRKDSYNFYPQAFHNLGKGHIKGIYVARRLPPPFKLYWPIESTKMV